ncbi:MAG: hypothetical protein F4Y67_07050 [Chloroflexi bacterium]|nr:hypothetical protein [Chloroflexota bacterium]
MANGKNVSLFASYPRSAAWELAQVGLELMWLPEFEIREFESDRRAMQIQARRVAELLSLAEKARQRMNADEKRLLPRGRVLQDPIDFAGEAERLSKLAEEGEDFRLIQWAQEMIKRLNSPAPESGWWFPSEAET